LRIERDAVERDQCLGPVQRFRDSRRLEEIHRPQALREGDDLARQRFACLRTLAADDRELAQRIGVADPVIETPALDRIVDLARAVRRDDHDGRRGRADRPELRNRDLELRQNFEKVCLERLVGAVEFVNEEDGCDAVLRRQGLEQRPLEQEARREDVVGERFPIGVSGRLREADLDHLPWIVPLVGGGRDVEPFVALEPDELPVECLRQHLGGSVLRTRLAFEEHRAAHLERQERAGREAAVGDVIVAVQQGQNVVDRVGNGVGS
jgi:hypothetical protein